MKPAGEPEPSGSHKAGRRTPTGIWRFEGLLPDLAPEFRISLGEGNTPLIEAPRLAAAIGLHRLFLKLESQNPTGSFKDRGSAYAVSHAYAEGARQIVEDSSGNAGASVAAYAARAGLRCTIFAPATAPAAKLRQAAAYGAAVELVEGDRDAVAAAARAAARGKGVYHIDHNSSAAFAAGTGTVAVEVSESLASLPAMIMPVGGGSMLGGAYQTFNAMKSAGAISAIPALFAAQAAGCAPLVQALDRGWDRTVAVQPAASIAGGIMIADPPRGSELLVALRQSGGGAVAVSDEAILRWRDLLARLEGVYAEPTSAAAVAGLARLVAERRIAAGGEATVIITGSGLKDG